MYLREGRHFSEDDMKWAITFMFATGLLVVLLGGFLSDRLVRKKGLLFGRRFLGMTILGGTAVALFITGFTASATRFGFSGIFTSCIIRRINTI